MKYVNAVRLSDGGTKPSHITDLRYTEGKSGPQNESSRAVVVLLIDDHKWDFRVANPAGGDVKVYTVHPASGDAYVQTKPDNTTADNLLSLPRF